jgi:hypothetical protein
MAAAHVTAPNPHTFPRAPSGAWTMTSRNHHADNDFSGRRIVRDGANQRPGIDVGKNST